MIVVDPESEINLHRARELASRFLRFLRKRMEYRKERIIVAEIWTEVN